MLYKRIVIIVEPTEENLAKYRRFKAWCIDHDISISQFCWKQMMLVIGEV